jgi:putative SOS response-associated peptidase YedK
MINARAETVAAKPAFRRSFERMRCLIPAGGFYEWQRRDAGPKRAFHITDRDRDIFAFAGIWAVWHSPDGHTTVRSCSIVTTAANAAVAPLHDRMPVILPRDGETAWLAPDTPPGELRELMGGLPAAATVVREVSRRVNDVRYDGPACLADPETGELTPAETVQPSLF